MKTTKKQMQNDATSTTSKNAELEKRKKKSDLENAEVELYSTSTEDLMPELEALVKKNPNRLIGCGG